MKKRLEKFYASFGDKGVMFVLYILSLTVNLMLSVLWRLPAGTAEEIASAGTASFYIGRPWGDLLKNVGTSSGYVQQMLYAPLFAIFGEAESVYRGMLVINSFLISFVPPIAYHLAAKIGVAKVRRKFLCALCAGFFLTCIAGSKSITSDTLAILMTWLLAWVIFSAWDKKNKYARFSLTVLAAFLCVVGFACDTRMLSVIAAVLVTVIVARAAFKEKIFNLTAFAASLIGFFMLENVSRKMVFSGAYDGLDITVPVFDPDSGSGGFFGSFFGSLYAFFTQSFGMGALAAALFFAMIFTFAKEGIKNKENVLEDGTKVYESGRHKYSLRPAFFGMFQFFSVIFSTVFTSLGYFEGSVKHGGFAGLCRAVEFLEPTAVFFVTVFVSIYGLNLRKIFIGAGIYAYGCLSFGLTYGVCETFGQTGGVFPLLAFRIGEGVSEDLGAMSFVVASSCVFAVFSLLIIIASCSTKHFKRAFSCVMYLILTYNFAYAAFFYIPEAAAVAGDSSFAGESVSQLLFNDTQSPPIIVLNDSENAGSFAGEIQFINFRVRVSLLMPDEKVPQNCILVASNGTKAPFDGGSYDVVGKTDSYTVYAYGESARNFIKYSQAGEAERK